MKNFKLLVFLFMSSSCGLFAQTLINVEYNPWTNCVNASFNECSIFLQGNISAVNSCECHRECNNNEPTEEELEQYEDCIDRCLDHYDDDIVTQDYCLDACQDRFESAERGCHRDCPPGNGIKCRPCRIVYRLYADFAPIPNDPLLHPGNRFVSQIFMSGGNGNGCVTVSANEECENICSFICKVNEPIEFECFELPESWQELSSGNNVCYGIEVLQIFFVDCNGESNCPFQLQGGEAECLIIG